MRQTIAAVQKRQVQLQCSFGDPSHTQATFKGLGFVTLLAAHLPSFVAATLSFHATSFIAYSVPLLSTSFVAILFASRHGIPPATHNAIHMRDAHSFAQANPTILTGFHYAALRTTFTSVACKSTAAICLSHPARLKSSAFNFYVILFVKKTKSRAAATAPFAALMPLKIAGSYINIMHPALIIKAHKTSSTTLTLLISCIMYK